MGPCHIKESVTSNFFQKQVAGILMTHCDLKALSLSNLLLVLEAETTQFTSG